MSEGIEADVRATEDAIPEFIDMLASDRWADRRNAEEGLLGLGSVAVEPLVDALVSPILQVRWGAAKVLGEIADPEACPALVEALEDDDGGVRWLAAQGLIRAGRHSLVPLLRQLLTRAESPWLQEGAHHVLRGLANATVSPVIVALEGHYPAHSVPVAANDALREIESGG